MPRKKDLKRLTRARMRKTGEAYTTARSQLLAKKDRKTGTDRPAPGEFATLAGMSDAAVAKATGCDWRRWVGHLDSIGAAAMPHREIAAHVHEKFGVSGWWAQTVTVGYERIRGLREIGQRRGGGYEVSKSKTVPVPLGRLYRACRDVRTRRRWLPGVELEVRKATREKSMRITWPDGTSVEVYFYAKDDAKSQVTVQHRKLASKAEADRLRRFWGERLTALAGLLAG